MPRAAILWVSVVAAWLAAARPCGAQPQAAEPPLILVHYMPWFAAKPVSATWGWHWTMNAFNPDEIKNGERSIASHYRPLIGPYDSGDPVVLEYHLLTMKLAGIDGVIVDWYGRTDHFDYAVVHRNVERLQRMASRFGMKFAVCYEDQTLPRLAEAGKLLQGDRVKHARSEIEWLRNGWLRESNYVRIDGKPLLLSFGFSGLTDQEWTDVFQGLTQPPLYLSEHRRRPVASGAFDWPVPRDYPASLDRFRVKSAGFKVAVPVAFPRFHDIYQEAKVHESHGRIPDDDGRTWTSTLERALRSQATAVQLATWNDWGEGTIIEPSREFGYRDLEASQRLRTKWGDKSLHADPADLRLPLRLLKLRRTYADRTESNVKLDAIAALLASRKTNEAKSELERFEDKN